MYRSSVGLARSVRGLVYLSTRTRVRPRSLCCTRSFLNVQNVRWAATAEANTEPERFEFQAETKNLLDIVAKSLYSDQEVFIRELVSNASDALERRRCVHLADGSDASIPYEIRVTTDEENNRLIFEDNGIGMDKEDLVKCLGTIAKSGSKEFVEKQKNGKDASQSSAESIIGQFGVGFYSAFMVAEKVVVATRKESSEVGYIWQWNGSDAYSIEQSTSLPVGTRIELSLKPGDASAFSKPQRVIDVINKYSYFVTVPISVNGERVNTLNAIWTMNPNEVTADMHETFFRQLCKTHHPYMHSERPQYTIHYKADAPINVRSLLYVPTRHITPLEFASETDESGVSLYARKILIKAKAKELLPRYLRFLVGVVDSEDVPLNLSREMLQMDNVIIKLRNVLSEKVVSYFVKQMKKDRIKYTDFYKEYGLYFKEGLCMETEQSIKEQLGSLLLFESSNFKAGVTTCLGEYVERMQADQNEIYYLFAPSRQLAENSPYYEMFKARNREVLFIYEAADDVVFLSLPQFRMKALRSVEKWAQSEGMDEKSNTEPPTITNVDKRDLLDWMKKTLGSVKVHEIVSSSRISEHPCMITVRTEMAAARHLMRLGQIKDMEHLVLLKPTLHVNLNHPIISSLSRLHRSDPKLAQLIVEQIYDNALVTSGLMKDSSKMISRINKLLTDLLSGGKSTILTP